LYLLEDPIQVKTLLSPGYALKLLGGLLGLSDGGVIPKSFNGTL